MNFRKNASFQVALMLVEIGKQFWGKESSIENGLRGA